jgi:hypothetical protein
MGIIISQLSSWVSAVLQSFPGVAVLEDADYSLVHGNVQLDKVEQTKNLLKGLVTDTEE